MSFPYRSPEPIPLPSSNLKAWLQVFLMIEALFLVPLIGANYATSVILGLSQYGRCQEKIQVLDIRDVGVCPSGTTASIRRDLIDTTYTLVCECQGHQDAGLP